MAAGQQEAASRADGRACSAVVPMMLACLDAGGSDEGRERGGREAGFPAIAIFQAGRGSEGAGAVTGGEALAVAVIGPFLGKGALETVGGPAGQQQAANRFEVAAPVTLDGGHAEGGNDQQVTARGTGCVPCMRAGGTRLSAADNGDRERQPA